MSLSSLSLQEVISLEKLVDIVDIPKIGLEIDDIEIEQKFDI